MFGLRAAGRNEICALSP